MHLCGPHACRRDMCSTKDATNLRRRKQLTNPEKRTTMKSIVRPCTQSQMKLPLLLLVLAASLATPALAQDEATSNMEILRQKVAADKKLLIAANMNLTQAEARGFWPVYDAYQQDLRRINERLGKVIAEYAKAYNKRSVDNETAKRLLEEALAIEEAEVRLKRSYLPRLEKVLPETKVARYLQIETKIRALARYELAAQIPLVY